MRPVPSAVSALLYLVKMQLEPGAIELRLLTIGGFIASPSYAWAGSIFLANLLAAVVTTWAHAKSSRNSAQEAETIIKESPPATWMEAGEIPERIRRRLSLGPFYVHGHVTVLRSRRPSVLRANTAVNSFGSPIIFLPEDYTGDFDTLHPSKRWILYHELGHASFAGADHWASLFSRPVTLGSALLTATLLPSISLWWFTAFILIAIPHIVMSSNRALRKTLSEALADRVATRWLSEENIDVALQHARMKIHEWSAAETWELRVRRMHMRENVHRLQRLSERKWSVPIPEGFTVMDLWAEYICGCIALVLGAQAAARGLTHPAVFVPALLVFVVIAQLRLSYRRLVLETYAIRARIKSFISEEGTPCRTH